MFNLTKLGYNLAEMCSHHRSDFLYGKPKDSAVLASEVGRALHFPSSAELETVNKLNLRFAANFIIGFVTVGQNYSPYFSNYKKSLSFKEQNLLTFAWDGFHGSEILDQLLVLVVTLTSLMS